MAKKEFTGTGKTVVVNEVVEYAYDTEGHILQIKRTTKTTEEAV